MVWSETLPQGCPPSDALEPNNMEVFRLVKTIPPTEVDFYSHRKLEPEKVFHVSECIARSISVFNDLSACNAVKKLPKFKNETFHTIKMLLDSECGVVLNRNGIHHFSFWMRDSFNPIERHEAIGVEERL